MTLSPLMRWVLVALAAISAVVAARRVLDESDTFERDFIQEFLVGRAILDGGEPYRPLPELANEYLPEGTQMPWPHACPHPPPTAVLSVPFGLMPHRTGKTLWLLLELACLAGFIEAMSRWWGGTISWLTKATVFCLSLSLGPVIRELWHGQFSLLLLAILTAAWFRLRQTHEYSGGALLGLAIALKLAGWPIAIFLAIRWRWKAAMAAALVVVGLNAVAALVIGWAQVVEYYTVIGPRIARDNRQHFENFSLWTVGSRFFGGDSVEGLGGFVTQPIFVSPLLERAATYGLPLVALGLAIAGAMKCRSFDSAMGILILAGLVINPVVWDHYLILAALPMTICLRRLTATGFTATEKCLVMAALAIMIVPPPAYLDATVRIFQVPRAEGDAIVPFLPGLMTYLPLIPLGIWTLILLKSDHAAANEAG